MTKPCGDELLTGDGEAEEGDEEHLVALLGEVRLALIADDGLVVAARASGDEGEEADEDKGGGLHGAAVVSGAYARIESG